jgi:hypothetical protein
MSLSQPGKIIKFKRMKKRLLSLICLFPLQFFTLPVFSQNIASNGDTLKANELLEKFQTGE